MSTVHVIGLDHLVLRCEDVDASLDWYTTMLGLEPVRVPEWRAGTVPFPSVRVDAGAIIDLIPRSGPVAEPNLDHLCVVVAHGDVDAVAAQPGTWRIVEGPAPRFGARGDGWSIYVLDPDDNIVELRSYPPIR
jgi:catechol 2,3-dioxygenase-like lactoylglutathione lyase family enzyme